MSLTAYLSITALALALMFEGAFFALFYNGMDGAIEQLATHSFKKTVLIGSILSASAALIETLCWDWTSGAGRRDHPVSRPTRIILLFTTIVSIVFLALYGSHKTTMAFGSDVTLLTVFYFACAIVAIGGHLVYIQVWRHQRRNFEGS